MFLSEHDIEFLYVKGDEYLADIADKGDEGGLYGGLVLLHAEVEHVIEVELYETVEDVVDHPYEHVDGAVDVEIQLFEPVGEFEFMDASGDVQA